MKYLHFELEYVGYVNLVKIGLLVWCTDMERMGVSRLSYFDFILKLIWKLYLFTVFMQEDFVKLKKG